MPSQTSKARPSEAETISKELPSPVILLPIHVHSSPASQVARHIQPVLLVSLCSFGFKHLVADPVSSMRNALPLIIAIQGFYAFLCLPTAGSQSSKVARKPRPGEKKANTDGTGPNILISIFISLLLSVFVTPLFYVIMVLFGAPVLTHGPHTFLCSLHLSILTLFPLFYGRGVDPAAWLATASFQAPFDEAFGGLFGGAVGAWLGAVPIPLDWDREWQKWPITVLFGLYGGYVVGKLVGGTLAFGKKF